MNEAPSSIAQLGDYTDLRLVGQGGMGVVYEAWDTRLNRRVALKMLHPHLSADHSFSELLFQEARNAAAIEHSNVVRIYRVERLNDALVIEMQYVEGTPLSRIVGLDPLPLEQVVSIFYQVLRGLEVCHRQGIVNCDVKPGNILVTTEGHVYVTDFGIARAHAASGAMVTPVFQHSATPWGTPLYSPPEAWEGQPATPRWDVFAVGVIILQALGGLPAYPAFAAAGASSRKTGLPRHPALEQLAGTSRSFSELVRKMASPLPEERPADAHEALVALLATREFEVQSPITIPLQRGPRRAQARAEETEPAVTAEPPPPAQGTWLRYLTAAFVIFVLAGISLLWTEDSVRTGPGPASSPSHPQQIADAPGPTAAPAPHPSPYRRPSELTVCSATNYFVAEDAAHGRELWSIVGNQAELAADILPGPASSNPHGLLARGAADLLFVATTPEAGEELWYFTDNGGGNKNVRMIKDILPGAMGSSPRPVQTHQNLVYFYATTLREGTELWCTNTLPEQTALVRDIFPGVQGSMPMNPTCLATGGNLYLVALTDVARGNVLWKYNLETGNLNELTDVAEDTIPQGQLGARVYFTNFDSVHGRELWVYDEGAHQAQLFLDIEPGAPSSNPAQGYVWRGRLYFQARTAEQGIELWSTDGTPSGTGLLADMNPGAHDSDPYDFTPFQEWLVFRAKDEAHGQELWVTDGTPAGTLLLADLNPGPLSSTPYNLSSDETTLLFSANDGVHGEELWMAWIHEGAWQTRMVMDLWPGLSSAEPHDLRWTAGGAIFIAQDAPNCMEVFSIDRQQGEPLHQYYRLLRGQTLLVEQRQND